MGEVFSSAQKNATARQREQEHRRVEGSLDSPLLLEQVTYLLSYATCLYVTLELFMAHCDYIYMVFYGFKGIGNRVVKTC